MCSSSTAQKTNSLFVLPVSFTRRPSLNKAVLQFRLQNGFIFSSDGTALFPNKPEARKSYVFRSVVYLATRRVPCAPDRPGRKTALSRSCRYLADTGLASSISVRVQCSSKVACLFQ